MKLFTLGFTKKTARQFFETLRTAGVKKLIDIRLNNTSQLAGFTKKEDLEYFVQTICGASYHHMPNLAPTQEILDALKKHSGTWAEYEQSFISLLRARGAIEKLERSFFEEPCCLLCSEATPEHCHRRLVAEEIQRRWPDVVINHL
jgi:uncharacterized protein (DUF488 family)